MKIHHCGIPYDLDGRLDSKSRFWHGFYLHSAGVTIDQSEIYSNAGTGVTISGESDIIVRNSVIHDHPIQGILNDSNTGQQIYNNLLYNNVSGIQLSGPNTRIYNNTILGRQDSRIELTAGIYLQAGIASQVIENNIIADFNRGIVVNAPLAPHVIANNLFYNNVIPGQGVYDINDFSNGAYTLSNNLMGIYSDVRFVNAAARDYRLLSGSPAIDAGNANGLTADADGCLRPVGAGVDIGAYEYAPSCSFR
jgi:nitrous oxidase accessory protein NosD